MTETVGIRQDVTNSYHDSTTQFRSHYLPATSGSSTLSYKRRILNRFAENYIPSTLAHPSIAVSLF
jgi:hypothetical protein